jgi:hypothetical protein
MTKKLSQSELNKMAEEWMDLHDDAVDFVTEIRGMILGAKLLAHPTKSKTSFALIMALTMMQVELVLNTMQRPDGKPMDKNEIRDFLISMLGAVIPTSEDGIIGMGVVQRKGKNE